MVSKSHLISRLITFQFIGYFALICLITGDEVFHIPHYLFGAPLTPINIPEIFVETIPLFLISCLTIILNYRFVKRIKYLEGYIAICSNCKKIRDGKLWVTLETYISSHSESLFTHSLCPDCAKKMMED